MIGIFLILAGCDGIKTSSRGVVLDLAQQTPEGGFIFELKKGLDGTSKCTLAEYDSKIAAFSPVMKRYGFDISTDSERILTETKLCNPQIIENTKYIDNKKYVVSYNLEISPKCELKNIKNLDKESFLEIEVDTLNEKSNVIKGKFEKNKAELANQIKLFIPLTGNCLGPLLMSTNYLTDTIGTSPQKETRVVSSIITTPTLKCSEDQFCTVDLGNCSESDKASSVKGKDKIYGKIKAASYLDKQGTMCDVRNAGDWPTVDDPRWTCGTVSYCGDTDANTVETLTPLQCKDGQKCTVNLRGCSESQKASYWKGREQLEGKIALKGYLNKTGLVCDVTVEVIQAWPLEEETSWWCGKVSSCN